jgi:hypothetical protein
LQPQEVLVPFAICVAIAVVIDPQSQAHSHKFCFPRLPTIFIATSFPERKPVTFFAGITMFVFSLFVKVKPN